MTSSLDMAYADNDYRKFYKEFYVVDIIIDDKYHFFTNKNNIGNVRHRVSQKHKFVVIRDVDTILENHCMASCGNIETITDIEHQFID